MFCVEDFQPGPESLEELASEDRTAFSVAEFQKSLDFAEMVLQGTGDPLSLVGKDLIVLWQNHVSVEFFGPCVGRTCHEAYKHLQDPCESCPTLDAFRTGKTTKAVQRAFDKEGNLTWVEVTYTPLTDALGKLVAVANSAHDITERKMLQDHLSRSNKALSAINIVASTIGSSLDLRQILNLALDKVIEFLEADAGSIFLVEGQRGELRLAVQRGFSPDAVKEYEDRWLRTGETVYGLVASSRQPLVTQDFAKCQSLTGTVAKPGSSASLASVPIKSREKVLGVLSVASHSRRPFRGDDVDLLVAISDQLGMAIDNARLYEELREQSITDELTGLRNSRYLKQEIEREVRLAERYARSLALMMIDSDSLKMVNDSFGHHQGDKLLQDLGRIIHSTVRETDVAVRYAGDEFMVLMPNTDAEGASLLAERIRSGVADYRLPVGENAVATTVSVGIAAFPTHARTAEGLLHCADEAMYVAKSAGKNGVVVYPSLAPTALSPTSDQEGTPRNLTEF